MKQLSVVFILILCVVVASCVPHKNIVYLQNKEMAIDTMQIVIEKQKPYRIQINDILSVRVKALDQETVQILNPIGEENLNADGAERAYFDGFTVDLHGNIRIPTLGYINVLGFTTEEIQKMIEAKLLAEQYKKTANIFVTVKLTGLRYTVYGEVSLPGTKVLYQERATIYEALANVGDITDYGNRQDVLIIRQYPQGQKIHHIDLTDRKVMQSDYYYIQPNDNIYVKPIKQKTLGTGVNARESLTTLVSIVSLIATTILLIKR